MAFKKGDTKPKKSGRAKGTPNKTTSEIRQAYQSLVSMNLENMTKWLERVAKRNPAKAIELINGLSEYILPKLQRTDLDLGENATVNLNIIKNYGHKPD